MLHRMSAEKRKNLWADMWQCGAAAIYHHFKKPVMIVEGKMQYLFDETGKRFLDVSHSRMRQLPLPKAHVGVGV